MRVDAADAANGPVPLVQDNVAGVNIHQAIAWQDNGTFIRGGEVVLPPVPATCTNDHTQSGSNNT